MASLQGFLPVAGSAVWRKDRHHSLASDSEHGSVMIKHIVIREVWQKKVPSPHAVYKIDVMTKSSHWFILRRYREFHALHKKLVKSYGIAKDMLPPKKLSSNLSLNHLQKRREALEHYLQRLVNSTQDISKSQEMFEFLEVKTNDVQFVTRNLAKYLAEAGDSILSTNGSISLTPTQLHCITKQLVLPNSTEDDEENDTLVDLGHLYSFLYQLEHLIINNEMTTDIYQDHLNHLKFDISLMKDLRKLEMNGCPTDIIDNMNMIQHQITQIAAHKTLNSIKELIVECVTAKKMPPKTSSRTGSSEQWRTYGTAKLVVNHLVIQPWVSLTDVNFSHNKIFQLDNSLKLLPVLRKINLSYNDIGHLDLQTLYCPSLTHINLSHNSISYITATAKDISHIKSLVLNHNQLQTLEGVDCLCGVVELDLCHNKICSENEVRKLSPLYQLKYLYLAGNTIAAQRLLILSYFKDQEVVLDGKLVTSEEKVKFGALSPSSSVPNNTRQQNQAAEIDSDDLETWCDTDESDNDSGISGYFSQSRLIDNNTSTNYNTSRSFGSTSSNSYSRLGNNALTSYNRGQASMSEFTNSQQMVEGESARRGTNPFSEDCIEDVTEQPDSQCCKDNSKLTTEVSSQEGVPSPFDIKIPEGIIDSVKDEDLPQSEIFHEDVLSQCQVSDNSFRTNESGDQFSTLDKDTVNNHKPTEDSSNQHNVLEANSASDNVVPNQVTSDPSDKEFQGLENISIVSVSNHKISTIEDIHNEDLSQNITCDINEVDRPALNQNSQKETGKYPLQSSLTDTLSVIHDTGVSDLHDVCQEIPAEETTSGNREMSSDKITLSSSVDCIHNEISYQTPHVDVVIPDDTEPKNDENQGL